MLVVIAILATLSALLLPVLTGAKKSAGRAVCSSNLRQIGMAVSLYAQDFDDVYAFGIDSFTSRFRNSVPGQVEPNALVAPLIEPLLSQYGAERRLFKCPADRGQVRPWSVFSYHDLFGTSYVFHAVAFLTPESMTASPNPADAPLVWDIDWFHIGTNSRDARIATLHRDGHYSFMRWATFLDQVGY